MRRYGLIGFPLGHSFSQGWFTQMYAGQGLTDCVYENHPLKSIGELLSLVGEIPDFQGFNVTIPYKEAILPYLNELDPQAAAAGAVNCVKIMRGNGGIRLKGYNTDIYGFEHSLLAMLGAERPPALVLGTGGACKAVGYVLGRMGVNYRMVSRRGGGDILSYGELTPGLISSNRLIINTTPLGMFPAVETLPTIPYPAVGPGHFLYDLVYNPAQTAFLYEGRRRGAAVMNGYAMLVAQARRSWEIWNSDH